MKVGGLEIEIVFTGERMTLDTLLDLARRADEARFAGIWMAEAFRSSLVPLAAIATVAPNARLGTNVAQWTRTVPNLDLAAGDMAEWTKGRFRLGLGSSTKEWNEAWHNIAYVKPVGRMREYVEALRLLWTAGPETPVSYDGAHFQIRDYLRFNGPLTIPVPIHLAASRPAMARLAGEIADGVNFNSILTPEYIESRLLPPLREGIERSRRHWTEVERGVSVIAACSPTGDEAIEWCRHQVAFYCCFTTYFEGVMDLHGLLDEYSAVRGLYANGEVAGAISAVSDTMVDTVTLCGTAEEVREKVSRYSSVCNFVMLSPPSFTLGGEEIRRNLKNLIEAFAS